MYCLRLSSLLSPLPALSSWETVGAVLVAEGHGLIQFAFASKPETKPGEVFLEAGREFKRHSAC